MKDIRIRLTKLIYPSTFSALLGEAEQKIKEEEENLGEAEKKIKEQEENLGEPEKKIKEEEENLGDAEKKIKEEEEKEDDVIFTPTPTTYSPSISVTTPSTYVYDRYINVTLPTFNFVTEGIHIHGFVCLLVWFFIFIFIVILTGYSVFLSIWVFFYSLANAFLCGFPYKKIIGHGQQKYPN
jgi:Flp pilus assembly protein TadB